MLRPRFLNGVATKNIVIMPKSTFFGLKTCHVVAAVLSRAQLCYLVMIAFLMQMMILSFFDDNNDCNYLNSDGNGYKMMIFDVYHSEETLEQVKDVFHIAGGAVVG